MYTPRVAPSLTSTGSEMVEMKEEMKTGEATCVGGKVSFIAKDDVPVTVTGSVADSLRPV